MTDDPPKSLCRDIVAADSVAGLRNGPVECCRSALLPRYAARQYGAMSDDIARVYEADRRVSQTDADGVVRLSATRIAAIDLDRVLQAFAEEAHDWLGPPDGIDDGGLTQYLCDLELKVSPERRSIFRKAAIVSVGRPVRQTDRWLVPIAWRAATLAPLFPVFAGRLTVYPDRLELDGHYAPPFGMVGFVLDRALLTIAARRTAFWFLAKIEGVIGEGT